MTTNTNSAIQTTSMLLKILAIVVLIFTLFTATSTINSHAIDKRISASSVKNDNRIITASEAKNNKNWEKGFYKSRATGYITSSTKHYANSELLALMEHVNYSGRKWGTGKVTATTAYGKNISMITEAGYGCRIYYGF